jgi:uncharacterized protein YkwD
MATARSASAAWSEVTRSPWPLAAGDASARERSLGRFCGQPDAALQRVARALAEERARGLGAPDTERVGALLRAAGEPHPRPRLLTATGRAPVSEETLAARLGELGRPNGRCGVAIASAPHGRELLVAVAVDVLADLAPLPSRARVGEWLSVDASLRVGARSASFLVLGPRGAPRAVPTSFDAQTGRVRARFAPDCPGAFTVQLVAELEAGPRPLLEARVFADVSPPADLAIEPAPGEDAAGGAQGAEALARMIAAARAEQRLPALVRDERLDSLANEHARRMKREGAVAHDLGDGDLRARFESEGWAATAVGENVARARTVGLAHRALHASPSHRMNLLRPDFTHLGVAVALGDDGDVYACEVFASDLR